MATAITLDHGRDPRMVSAITPNHVGNPKMANAITLGHGGDSRIAYAITPEHGGDPEVAARIDRLVCSLAQEDGDHDACLQAVVDACLRRWVGHVAEADACASHTADAPPEFEDLVACASYYSKNACERLGFVEEESPDLAVRPVVTHRARLPAVILAYKTLGENDALIERLGVLLVVGGHVLAMAAPRGEELHEHFASAWIGDEYSTYHNENGSVA